MVVTKVAIEVREERKVPGQKIHPVAQKRAKINIKSLAQEQTLLTWIWTLLKSV